jgi:hypothetical protein
MPVLVGGLFRGLKPPANPQNWQRQEQATAEAGANAGVLRLRLRMTA